MFKKKPNIKTLSPLRSSDRRKTADRIIADFQLSPATPNEGDSDPQDAAATAPLTSLRSSLLPENTQSAKFTTTSGPDLAQVTGTVFVGKHDDTDQRILWIKLNDVLYPSVYTLWRNPGIVPLLHTPSIVVEKFKGGADLMTPGLARGPPFPPKATKGAVVAIASLESPSVPVAVGVCEIDVSALGRVQGQKGHAVQIIHCAGDEVWSYSPVGRAGWLPETTLDGWDDEPVQGLVDGGQALSLEDQDQGGGVALASQENGHSLPAEEPVAETFTEESRDLITQEIDDSFRNAFIYGVYHHKQSHKDTPKHGLDFPLNQSVVMSSLVLPFLPTHTAKDAEALTIKRTSWKNIRKFIKYLDKQKLVLSKEKPGNEVIILDIDFDDPAFTTFVPYSLPKKDSTGSAGQIRAESNDTANGSDVSLGQRLKRVELYKPRGKLIALFKSAGGDSRYYTPIEIKSHVTSYIETNNLVSPTNKRLVNLDPLLSNSVFVNSTPSTSSLDRQVLSKGSCPRDVLQERVLQGCAPYHLILRSPETVETTTQKPKAGAAPRVHIATETRSGNKTITRVSGVQSFFILPQPLADELRKVCAGSTSVEQSKSGKGLDVCVQGPQRDIVIAALEKRGVPKQWIDR